MKFQLRRLFWAFFLSGACFLSTFIWSRAQIKPLNQSGGEKLAEVTAATANTRKKLVNSLQWLPLEPGDRLFDGDTIRTYDLSEAEIHFDDKRSIKVESNTTFVIQKMNNEISLDLKEGSVVVDAKSDATSIEKMSNLVLLTQDKRLELSGSKTQVTKSKDSNTKLNVIEGQTRVKSKDGSVKDLRSGTAVTLSKNDIKVKDEIKILSPNLVRGNDKSAMVFYVDPEVDSTIPFRWKGTAKQDETVLLTGISKTSLVAKDTAAPGRESINTTLPIGEHYWQLVSKNPLNKEITYESPVYRLFVQTRSAALVLSPKIDEIIVYEVLPHSVLLKWQKPEAFKSINLEISTSQTMSIESIVASQNVSNLSEFKVPLKAEGDYYFRLSTRFEDMDRPMYTKIQKFKLVKKEPPKPPPVLTWGTTLEKQYFFDKPKMALTWDALSRKEDITGWKLEVTDNLNVSLIKKELIETRFMNDQVKPGVYKLYLEAIDKNGQVMTKVGPKVIEILETPLPRAPVINSQLLNKNQNNNRFSFINGVVNLKWDYQANVSSYEVELVNSQTNRPQTLQVNKNSLDYTEGTKGLSPGVYQVRVTPIDIYKRRGPASETFEFEVPISTNMSAPKLKNLSIKPSGQ